MDCRDRWLKGSLSATYWTEGDAKMELFGIVEMPDALSIKAIELAVHASGAVHVTAVRLYSVDEMDAARGKLPPYRAPGQPLVQ